MSQEESDLRQCIANNTPVVGFVADPAYPEVTAANLWDLWLQYLLKGTFPPGTRVFCSVSLPSFT